MRVCIVGASGKLGQYMVQHALDRGYEVAGVCREESVGKLDGFMGRITVLPGATNDPEVIKRAVAGCDGVLVVLVPRGVHGYATGTAQAVLDHAPPGARLVFSCGWHITRDGQDVYSWKLKALVNVAGPLARLARFADLDDQVEACKRIFASDTRWTVVRGSDLEEGDSQGLPVWSRHVGDPILKSNRTRRVDLPCSWWKPCRTMDSSTRPRRSSAGRRPRRSRTPPANDPIPAPAFPSTVTSTECHSLIGYVVRTPAATLIGFWLLVSACSSRSHWRGKNADRTLSCPGSRYCQARRRSSLDGCTSSWSLLALGREDRCPPAAFP